MFQRWPDRLDDEALILRAIRVLHQAGYDRARIATALIERAPVDLDLLAECYARLMREEEQGDVRLDRAA